MSSASQDFYYYMFHWIAKLINETMHWLIHWLISIESTDKKLINAELALLFNETCKNKNSLPRYTDIQMCIYICIYMTNRILSGAKSKEELLF